MAAGTRNKNEEQHVAAFFFGAASLVADGLAAELRSKGAEPVIEVLQNSVVTEPAMEDFVLRVLKSVQEITETLKPDAERIYQEGFGTQVEDNGDPGPSVEPT